MEEGEDGRCTKRDAGHLSTGISPIEQILLNVLV
jgi:hypothetical protein